MMGYTTRFEGALTFTTEPTATQLASLNAFFGEDCRDHPEWGEPQGSYVDFELTPAFDGIQWNGAEKSYGLEKAVNVIIREMRKQWPEFGLTGTLSAQGEDVGDRWALHIADDGFAVKQKIVVKGRRVTCPHCDETFLLEDAA